MAHQNGDWKTYSLKLKCRTLGCKDYATHRVLAPEALLLAMPNDGTGRHNALVGCKKHANDIHECLKHSSIDLIRFEVK